MAESEGYADQAIRELLAAAGPLTAAAIAEHLAVPVRTVRHRLMRLRESGSVVRANAGLHALRSTVEAIPRDPRPSVAQVPVQVERVDSTSGSPKDQSGSHQALVVGVTGLATAIVTIALAMLSRRPAPGSAPLSQPTSFEPDRGFWED